MSYTLKGLHIHTTVKITILLQIEEDSKIAKPKIATKIKGFYSIDFVESKGDSKITTKIKGFYSNNIKYIL